MPIIISRCALMKCNYPTWEREHQATQHLKELSLAQWTIQSRIHHHTHTATHSGSPSLNKYSLSTPHRPRTQHSPHRHVLPCSVDEPGRAQLRGNCMANCRVSYISSPPRSRSTSMHSEVATTRGHSLGSHSIAEQKLSLQLEGAGRCKSSKYALMRQDMERDFFVGARNPEAPRAVAKRGRLWIGRPILLYQLPSLDH